MKILKSIKQGLKNLPKGVLEETEKMPLVKQQQQQK